MSGRFVNKRPALSEIPATKAIRATSGAGGRKTQVIKKQPLIQKEKEMACLLTGGILKKGESHISEENSTGRIHRFKGERP
jgi:hypothetical protein